VQTLIVDCHSVIFAWPELLKEHQRNQRLARERLTRLLTEYQDYSGLRVVAVFDGKGARFSEVSEPGGIQIFYSGADQTADDIIERLVAKYAAQHEIQVATNDLMEQTTVETFGAFAISVDSLRDRMEEARGDFERRLKQHRRKR
jgi:predicted RNA-binding protein with PIN domain